MAPLITSNPYLRDANVRRRILAESARDSSQFEGARHLPPVAYRTTASRPRVSASTKNAIKGS